jgi:4-methylaminobutanoate oxidase (formaldehyde-forming)
MKHAAETVIVGGGIAGASIAYHLARLGRRDVVVLDQGELVSGTTSHAPGLVGQLRASPTLARMLMYSVTLYRGLRADGVAGFLGEGSLRVASSPRRFLQLQKQARLAEGIGLEARLISPREAVERFPLMNPDGIEGALYIPGDGSAVAPVLARALIDAATDQGVEFHPSTAVRRIDVVNGRVAAVETTRGRVATDSLVVAAGIWSPLLGSLAGVAIPLTPMQHQYVVTEPLPVLAGPPLPNLRDPDRLIYLRQRDQGLVLGGYERCARPFDVESIPERPEPTVLAFDPGAFEPLRRAAAERVPAFGSVELARQVNGLESFTPDGEFLLGPAPEVRGLWVACGFCAHGVSGAGGVGKVMAEWIVSGDPGVDASAMDLRRFAGRAPDRHAIRQAASAVYGTYYDITE